LEERHFILQLDHGAMSLDLGSELLPPHIIHDLLTYQAFTLTSRQDLRILGHFIDCKLRRFFLLLGQGGMSLNLGGATLISST
jgi:hypothetical protein